MMLRSRKNSNINAPQENQGPTKRHAAPVKDEPKRKRGGLIDLSNVMSNTLCIDSTKKSEKTVSKVGLKKCAPNSSTLEKKLLGNKLRLNDAGGRQGPANNKLSPVLEAMKKIEDAKALTIAKTSCEKLDPCPEFDFDKENEHDPYMVTEYARGIFQYYKHREKFFKIGNYGSRYFTFAANWRAVIVDWMVEMQESFELNHETFYTAVKIVDHFLDKTDKRIVENDLQLIGSVAIFIASKFEERCPPAVEDFIWAGNQSFTNYDLIAMERLMLKTIGYDLGFPLAYRFQRRYAKVLYLDMGTLTLARFYLETCTLYYQYVGVRDSLMGAACLLLALRVKRLGEWNSKLVKYSGYRLEDIEPLMWTINHAVMMRPLLLPRILVIHRKYSSDVFGEVALYRLLPDRFKSADPVGPPTDLSFASY